MSKIINDGLTRSDTGCTYMATVGVKGLNGTIFIYEDFGRIYLYRVCDLSVVY